MTKQLRISDNEFELLKSTFADREELLKTMRNLFFGLPMSDDEKKQIKDLFSGNETLRKMMRKQFLPELQSDLPLGQAIDLWMTLDIKDKDIIQIKQITEARAKLLVMIETALSLLEDINGKKVDLTEWENDSWSNGRDTSLIARNTFISHIDQQLSTIRILAGMANETIEETKKRLLQDSTK